MATGINKSERLSKEALIAGKHHCDSFPLPPDTSIPTLEYSGKLSIDKVLASIDTDFSVITESGCSHIDIIPDNSFCLSDNLFVLHKLIQEKKKVQLIYTDPPYGTGLDFQSRELKHAYKDNMYLSMYLEYMRRRLILMREVMSDDGSIYVHIGHQMLFHIKVIMDEVFGPSNFRNLITRRKCSSKNFTKYQYSNICDYLLFYTKSNNYSWNKPGTKPDIEWIEKEYNYIDAKGRYKLVPIHAPGVRNGETGMPWRGQNPPPGKHWQFTPAKLDEFVEKGEIHWSKNGNPRRKVYLTEDKSLTLTDYWHDYRDAHHQSAQITGYPTEKNFEMLKMIVGASSNPGDLVLDPFCGSGTTLHAARELGRKWIGVDQSYIAAKTVLNRLKNGTTVMGDYVKNSSKYVEPDLFPNETTNFIVDSYLIGEENQKDLESIFKN
jgi:adenine-specific DNA-methyltransferase